MKLLKFEAGWCLPCKALSMTLASMDIRIPVEKIDIEKNTDVATEYGIRSVPTMILMDENQNIVRKLTGNHKKETIQEFLGEWA